MDNIDRNKKGQFVKGFISKYRNIPIIGRKYNLLEVISEDVIKSNDGRIMFKVKCQCNKELWIRAYFLESGRQKGCKNCASRQAYAQCLIDGKSTGFLRLGQHQGTGNLTKTYYCYLKSGALTRDLEWDDNITTEYLWNLLLDQNMKCNLTGLDITMSTERHKGNPDYSKITASLDRIDNNKGYIVGNLQWLHKDINKLKWAFSQDKLFQMCKLICIKNKIILSQDLQIDENVVDKVQRLEGEDLTNNPSKSAQHYNL